MNVLYYLYRVLGIFLVPLPTEAIYANIYESHFNDHIEMFRNSEEHEWLNLLYLNKNAKLAATPYSNKSVLNFSLSENPNLVDAWKLLNDAGRTGGRNASKALTRNIEVLESLTQLCSNPKLSGLGITDTDLGNLIKQGGWGGEPSVPSYKQLCDELDELVNVLPENKGSKLNEFLGSKGFDNGLDYTRRHAYVQLKGLLENKSILSQADEVVFERRLSNTINGKTYESFTDIFVRIDNRVVEIETKAGMEFFTNVAGSNSNFAKQSFNSLKNIDELQNYKVLLNDVIKSTLDTSSDKLKVLEAWKNFEGGALLKDASIQSLFTKYGSNSGYDFTFNSVENFLRDTDDWFGGKEYIPTSNFNSYTKGTIGSRPLIVLGDHVLLQENNFSKIFVLDFHGKVKCEIADGFNLYQAIRINLNEILVPSRKTKSFWLFDNNQNRKDLKEYFKIRVILENLALDYSSNEIIAYRFLESKIIWRYDISKIGRNIRKHRETGKILSDEPNEIDGELFNNNGVLCVPLKGGQLLALDAYRGHQIWFLHQEIPGFYGTFDSSIYKKDAKQIFEINALNGKVTRKLIFSESDLVNDFYASGPLWVYEDVLIAVDVLSGKLCIVDRLSLEVLEFFTINRKLPFSKDAIVWHKNELYILDSENVLHIFERE